MAGTSPAMTAEMGANFDVIPNRHPEVRGASLASTDRQTRDGSNC
jgi:hypothetical protein